MWLRASLSSLALSSSLVGLASASTAIHEVNGVEVIISERDAPPPRATKPRTSQRATQDATPATRRASAAVAPEIADLPGSSRLIATALSYVGTPYVWGGAAPGGFDCSGFTYYAFASIGIRIPRTADVQFAAGRPVVGDPMPGDLVFFQTYDYGASHVGIYLGGGRFVNSIGESVHVATFGSTYFRERYLGARRFL